MNDLTPGQRHFLAELEPDVAEECQRHAEAIRVLGKRVAQDIIEIGQRLIAVKAALPHGTWLPWIEAEFGWGATTAQKFMNVAERIGPKLTQSGNLLDVSIDASALYALSGPRVEPELQDAVIAAAAEDTKRITVDEANRIAAELVAGKTKELTAKFNADSETIREEARVALAELRGEMEKALADAADDAEPEEPEPPTVADACEMLAQMTGRKRLSDAQVRALAQALETPITYGRTTFAPVDQAVSLKAAEEVRRSGECTRALEYFTTAPPPSELVDGMPEWKRKQIAKLVPEAVAWIEQFLAMEGPDGAS